MEKRNYKKYLPAIVFIVAIFSIGLCFIFVPKLEYSSNEKRILQEFPAFTFDSLISGEFGEDFEKYLVDHVVARDLFVGVNSYTELYTGRNGLNGVYSGSDNYLINIPTDENNFLESNIKLLSDFSDNTNTNASLIVVPSTGHILDDKLPLLHNSYNNDEYFNIIEENKGNMSFLNLNDLFLENKDNYNLYYKTDHHWTQEGAYLAYTEYCKSLGITPTAKSDFNIESYEGFYGTTYSKSALWLTPYENIDLWYNKNHSDNISVTIKEGDSETSYNSLYFTRHLKRDDKYPVFLDGNHSLVTIKNSAVTNDEKLLIIKDSFAHCFTPFLADNYSEIYMVDLRYYNDTVSDLIKEHEIENTLILYGLDNLSTDTDIRWLD